MGRSLLIFFCWCVFPIMKILVQLLWWTMQAYTTWIKCMSWSKAMLFAPIQPWRYALQKYFPKLSIFLKPVTMPTYQAWCTYQRLPLDSINFSVCKDAGIICSGVSRNLCKGVLYSARVKCTRKIFRPRSFCQPHPPHLSGHAHFQVCTIKNRTCFCCWWPPRRDGK